MILTQCVIANISRIVTCHLLFGERILQKLCIFSAIRDVSATIPWRQGGILSRFCWRRGHLKFGGNS